MAQTSSLVRTIQPATITAQVTKPLQHVQAPLVYFPTSPHAPSVYTHYWPNGQLSIRAGVLGKIYHGEYHEWNEDGSLYMKANYWHGIRVGPCETYHPNGAVNATMTFNQYGKLEGLYNIYYDNGALKTKCYFHNGKFHGPYNTYYPDGSPEVIVKYDNGNPVGKMILIENGIAEVYDP